MNPPPVDLQALVLAKAVLFCRGLPDDAFRALQIQASGLAVYDLPADGSLADDLSRVQAEPGAMLVCWQQPPMDAVEGCRERNIPLCIAQYAAELADCESRTDRPVQVIRVEVLDAHVDATRVRAQPIEAGPVDPKAAEAAPHKLARRDRPDPLAGLLFARARDESGARAPASPMIGDTAPVTANDITLAFGVRLHKANPWILDRLVFAAGYYRPMPRVVIVDYGSEPRYSAELRTVCEAHGFSYSYVDDRETFSLSRARNVAAEVAETDFVFHSDPDFVMTRDFFARVAHVATVGQMRRYIDVTLMCAAYHLTADATRRVVATTDLDQLSDLLETLALNSIGEGFKRTVEFVAPYSNVFLLGKRYFSLVGGYNRAFRGHGSEDFEFFLRATRYSAYLPFPANPDVDTGGPMTRGFHRPRRYEGFRILNSLVALPGELAGLKAFHLYHPTPMDDGWRKANDWKRVKLKEQLEPMVEGSHNLLAIDGLPRAKKALCVCFNKDHWGYFVPLRLRGYELVPVFGASSEELEHAAQSIESGQVDAFCIFNPYMTSHAVFRPLHELARRWCKAIVVERGALPNTIYYASDVAYADPSFSEEALAQFVPTAQELAQARVVMSRLRTGNATLEDNAAYGETMEAYASLAEGGRPICFVPLQLEYDMAVTSFVRNAETYAEFAASLNDVAMANPDTLFIVKPHPLSKAPVALTAGNIRLAGARENIHALIDIATHTICYNSGVGLLSLLHGRPTYTIGNAYYNRGGTGVFCGSLAEAVARHASAPSQPDLEAVTRLVAWLQMHRYSTFTAVDDVRDFGERKAHGYKDVVVTRFVLDGVADDLERLGTEHPFSAASYLTGHLGLSLATVIPPRHAPTAGPLVSASVPGDPGTAGLPKDLRGELVLAAHSTRRDDNAIDIAPGAAGHGVYGPYVPLAAGAYSIRLAMETEGGAGLFARPCKVVVDIAANGGRDVLAVRQLTSTEILNGKARQEIEFVVPASHEPVPIELRVWTDGRRRLVIREATLGKIGSSRAE